MKTLTKTNENLTLAEKLYTLDQQVDFLKEQQEEVRAELLANLHSQGVKFVRLTNGTSYSAEYRTTLKVKNLEKALNWATKNNCLTVDIPKARQILRHEMKTPSFFKVEKGTEYLKVTHPKNENR